ncbi:MAG TPA: protein with SnoaL 3 domain, NTF 2 superfamily [Porticoccaceae bacterium]|nr:protein with SnoaL 3 domain, NTF 2 superfamily [Gammaproteobacteria bacterium]HIL59733.1 protein with SnoaL 3 domain, NTF 2 superfamily [Porticoccaceae bacterium]
MFHSVFASFFLPLLINSQVAAQSAEDLTAVNNILDAYHVAAAEANWESYFQLMSDDGVFLGSDAGERWTKAEFRAYASRSNGWDYLPEIRNVNFTPDGGSAWFDEILQSASYGTSRGTGILIKTEQGWKISQYALTFPIPNALAPSITAGIKEYESGQ